MSGKKAVCRQLPVILMGLSLIVSCRQQPPNTPQKNDVHSTPGASEVQLVVLGTLQDAGSPQFGCDKACCSPLYLHPDPGRKVVSLGIVDHRNRKSFLFEATPDITTQVQALKDNTLFEGGVTPSGIFLTHAHIGHYTGLMYLGKEAANMHDVNVYAMPRMRAYLKDNGPWSQLVASGNILLQELVNHAEKAVTSHLRVVPFMVPHRDEYSETVGFTIIGPEKKALFIPDIDKWDRWGISVTAEISKVDYAFIDATFYDASELPDREMSEIPHPFVIESLALFRNLPAAEKAKIYFIHLNHSNPLLDPNSSESRLVLSEGFNIAKIHSVFNL